MDNIDFSWLRGQCITDISFLNPTLIFSNGSLIIECPWRLREGANVIIGSSEFRSEPSAEEFKAKLKLVLTNKTVKSINLAEGISDLQIEFNDNLFLDLFHDSSYFEGWQLLGPEDFLLVALPGGGYLLKK